MQGQTYYEEAKREVNTASTEASKGINDLVTRARTISLNQDVSASTTIASGDGQTFTEEVPRASTDTTATARPFDASERPESLPADIVKEAETLLTRFRGEAAKRLKDIQKAEDAADEALLKFGTNIRNFLREAVIVTGPDSADGKEGDKVLFESKDADGKRVIHTTRFDAQLHVIHSSLDSFLRDPKSDQYEPWAADFDIDKRTDEIAKDLDKYEELRRAMEKCVPEKVEYKAFWTRYYFLRHVIETEESRRRELLKGTYGTRSFDALVAKDLQAQRPRRKKLRGTRTPTPKARPPPTTQRPARQQHSQNPRRSPQKSPSRQQISSSPTSRAVRRTSRARRAANRATTWSVEPRVARLEVQRRTRRKTKHPRRQTRARSRQSLRRATRMIGSERLWLGSIELVCDNWIWRTLRFTVMHEPVCRYIFFGASNPRYF
ncbi:MAG: hypothetical protein INR71_02605 [Terriglobus roseus]|nr:hypothetical protein [Terriglobus roseus]